MKMMRLRCPHCDANLETKDGLDIFYCTYCGGKIMLEGMSKQAYKARVSFKQMEHEENIKDKEYAQERFKIKQKMKEKALDNMQTLLATLLCFLMPFVFFGSLEIKHKSEINELKK